MADETAARTPGSAPGTEQISVPIMGMTCAACERKVARALGALPGVESATASAHSGRAILTVGRRPSDEAMNAALERVGYSVGTDPWVSKDFLVWRTFVLSALVVGLAVYLAWSLGLADLPSKLADPSSGGLMLVFMLGLTAGVSTCMALVGGLVLAVSASHAAMLARAGRPTPSFGTRMRPHVMFNVGRIVGFGILGALLGLVGGALSLPPAVMGLLLVAVAVVMALLGLRLTGVFPRLSAWNLALPSSFSRLVGLGDTEATAYSDRRAAGLGAATFFLPCGFTQAVQLYALSTASPLTAGLIMATFAIGTTPGLLALAGVPEVATGKARETVLRVVGVVVICFALINALGGLRLLGYDIGSASPSPEVAAATQAQQVSSNVAVANGAQTVTMTQNPDGYVPADTVVYAGLPITWVINGTSPYDCSAFLRVPSLGVTANLASGSNTVLLPALEAGVTPFTCVMGMYSGTLVAVEPPPGIAGL
jgi:sulfite exporter TauE/SafE/copper chaperone CopZ